MTDFGNIGLLRYAQLAAHTGANASERPAYDSSPNGMAFAVGLWARGHGVTVQEVKAGRGYTYTLNRSIRLNFKGGNENPIVTHL